MLLSAIFVPLIIAFILPLVGKVSLRLRNLLALGAILVSLWSSLAMVPIVASGKVITLSMQFTPGFSLTFAADGLAVFMAIVSSLISAIIICYSFSYISHYQYQNEYYSMAVLFLGAMMGLVFSSNLILLYIFWEITAITSWRLIGFFREKAYVLKADKAFLVTVFGALAMLIGFIGIYQLTGSFELSAIKEALKANPVSDIIVLLILVGIFSKSATLPFHTWLPDAGVAPSPVTALLHAAVLVKIGVYVFARLFLATFALPLNWHVIVAVMAGISAIVSGGAALRETDLKRLIAYSTISQIGFIFLGFAIGNNLAVSGALLFILMHGLAKAGLFLCAGIIEQNTKTKDITKLGGLISTMPITAISFLACAFSVMGVPPFGGFFSKYMVFSGAIKNGQLMVTALFLVAAFLTILYLFRVFNMVFMGEKKGPEVREASPTMVASVAILGILSLACGIFIYLPSNFTQSVVQQMAVVVK